MILGLDTSVAVRLLIGEPEAQAEAARRLLGEPDTEATISDLVVSEAYFALRHHYGVPHPKVIAALRSLVADPRIHPTGVARDVLASVPDRGEIPGFMDRLIHGDYENDGASLVTFDRSAATLRGARLLK